jgi:endonuclease V-like protein UPF0215 family
VSNKLHVRTDLPVVALMLEKSSIQNEVIHLMNESRAESDVVQQL